MSNDARSFEERDCFAIVLLTSCLVHPLQLRIADGSIGGGVLGTFQMKSTNVLLVASSTNYVFLDLSQSPPVLTVNQTGFPTTLVYKIATAVTSASQITSLTDSRPTFNSTISSGGGITSVASLPATCTPGTTQNVQINQAITIGSPSITYTAGTEFYCTAPNSWSPVSQGSGAAPNLGFYLCGQVGCPQSNAANIFFTPADTQICSLGTYTGGQTTVTCQTHMLNASASVTSNVVTYTFPALVWFSWAAGNSVTVSQFGGADAFFNQTCTLTAVTTQSISCALTHANASSTTLGQVLNTSAGPFSPNDCVGGSGCTGTGTSKRIFGYGVCSSDNNLRANGGNQPMTTGTALTIASYTSSLQVSLSSAATNSSGTPNVGCIIWGHPDDAGAAAMEAAMDAAPQCPRAHLAAGYYMFTVPHFYNQPVGCINLPSLANAFGSAGNLIYAAGFELDGRGAGTTTIFLTPSFPETGTCNHGGSKVGCFVVPIEGNFHDFQISGGGNFTSSNFTSGMNLIEVDGPATLDHVTCTNFGMGTLGTVGFAPYVWAQLGFLNNGGCGDANMATPNLNSAITCIRCSMENPNSFGYLIGSLTSYYSQNFAQFEKYNFTCYDCFGLNLGVLGSSMAIMRITNNDAVKLYHTRISPYTGLGINTVVGIQMFAGKLDLDDSFVDMSAGGTATATGNIGIQCTGGSGCTIKARNSIIKGTTGGNGYADVAGSVFNDEGGNTLGTTNIVGQFIGEANSANQIPVTAAKTVLSAGWGTTAAVTALSGGNAPIQFTITNSGTGQGASPTITYTFPTPYPVAPYSCTATQVGGTNATGTFTSSALSVTGVTFTFSLTPTAASTEIVQVTCVTP